MRTVMEKQGKLYAAKTIKSIGDLLDTCKSSDLVRDAAETLCPECDALFLAIGPFRDLAAPVVRIEDAEQRDSFHDIFRNSGCDASSRHFDSRSPNNSVQQQAAVVLQ